MTRLKRTTAGFTLIALLFGLVVLTTLATTGWMVYKSSQTPTALTTTTATPVHTYDPSTTAGVAATSQNLIKIPELGIQLTVPASLKGATYFYNSSNNPRLDAFGSTENTAGMSTTSLAAIDGNCSAFAGALGSITTGSGQWPPSVNASDNMSPLLFEDQLPNVWVAYSDSHAACSQRPSALTALQSGVAALRTALQAAQPLN